MTFREWDLQQRKYASTYQHNLKERPWVATKEIVYGHQVRNKDTSKLYNFEI